MIFVILIGCLFVIFVALTVMLAVIDCEGCAMITGMIGIVLLITFIAVLCCWITAEYTAAVFNRKYGTSYTQEEFFWAGETIKSLVEGTYSRNTIDLKIEGLK